MAKTISQYRTDLRLDLKDSGALWSNAELDRCVEKAVADYSRFVPREMSREITIDAEVEDESFTTPEASDTDKFVDDKDISAVTDGDTCTLAAQAPDVPRPVIVTITDANASITSFTIIVKGWDTNGKYMEESFFFDGGLVQTGLQYFALITEVELDEMTGEGAADRLDVGTGSHIGVLRELAYKPIKFGSAAVSGKTLDTDYEMDYSGGRIAMKSGGGMAAGTAYTIDYTKSRLDIDLSIVIPDFIKVERVEYPVGQVPQEFSKVEMWGSILTLTGGYASQKEVTDAEHLIIMYLAPHSVPSTHSPGSFPSYLDTTIQLAASAYALFIKALQYDHQAVTDLASVRTELGRVTVLVTATTGKIDLALTKVALYLESNGTTDNAKDRLAEITDIETYLRDLIIKLSDGTGALATLNSTLDEVDTTDFANATDGAEKMTSTGHPLINTVTDGARVAENYREYAQTKAELANARIQQAMGYFQEAAARLDFLRSYIEEAAGWKAIGDTFIEEATALINEVNSIIAEAAQYQETASNDMVLADKFKQEGMERRNEAWMIWASPHQIAPNYALGQRGQQSS